MIARQVPNGGRPEPRGASIVAEGVNFSVFSETASAIWVCLFDERDREIARFQLDGYSDGVHFGLIAGIGAGARYGLRADGPHDPARAYLFDPQKLLVDPYAKRLDRGFVRHPLLAAPREHSEDTSHLMPKALVVRSSTLRARPVRRAPGLIYELNVRGFTRLHPDIAPALRGTVSALTAEPVLDHFEKLGVDTVELMPVTAWIDDAHLPALGLSNAWGYNPVTYFAPDPRLMPRGLADLRDMTDIYRARGMQVVLDVVYNHTGEGDAEGPVLSLRGLDARSYYRHYEEGGRLKLVNDAGTGNTLRCEHPAVRRLVLDSLRHLVEEGGVSGFRFDLAPLLGQTVNGFDPDARLLAQMKSDPVLGKCVLIAEPWSPSAGGYQLGAFGKPFLEWNDRFRDDVRGFWRGEDMKLGALASRLSGSADVFNRAGRKPAASVNFIAAHDGFTLADLVTYSGKRNEANGENNRDGHAHNLSWNCGAEGPTENVDLIARRRRDVRALLATLILSRGTLMLQQGDEMGRTQGGNNNAYAQDNEVTWVDWAGADLDLADYVGGLMRFRREHASLFGNDFLNGVQPDGSRDVIWFHPETREMSDEDWHDIGGSVLGMHLKSSTDDVMFWFNRWIHPVRISCPGLPEGKRWRMLFSSNGPVQFGLDPCEIELPARSVIALAPVAAERVSGGQSNL